MYESDNPEHYKKDGIETWDAIGSQMSDEEEIGYLRGSAAKHLFRFGYKGGLTLDKAIMDIMKAMKYLQKLLDKLNGLKNEGTKMADAGKPTNVRDLFKDKDDR